MQPWAKHAADDILDVHEGAHDAGQDCDACVLIQLVDPAQCGNLQHWVRLFLQRREEKNQATRRRNRHVQKLESEMSQPRCMVNMNNNHTSSRLSPNLVTAHPTNQLSQTTHSCKRYKPNWHVILVCGIVVSNCELLIFINSNSPIKKFMSSQPTFNLHSRREDKSSQQSWPAISFLVSLCHTYASTSSLQLQTLCIHSLLQVEASAISCMMSYIHQLVHGKVTPTDTMFSRTKERM